jgi:GNAT superfamily N-acetyltransferase
VAVPKAPAIPGLMFRGFRGEDDFPAMLAVIDGSKEEDRSEWTNSLDDVARGYRHLVNCDPYQDMLFALVRGQVVGYSRVWWNQELDGTWLYEHFAHLLPRWRGTGIRRSLLRHNERRLQEVATGHNGPAPKLLQCWASETEKHWGSLLQAEGYEIVRYGYEMVRPSLDDIPDIPLPEGLEVRPVTPEQHQAIWKAAEDAFRDHWGETQWHDEYFEEWQESPTFQPELWQVAWDGDQARSSRSCGRSPGMVTRWRARF